MLKAIAVVYFGLIVFAAVAATVISFFTGLFNLNG